jgi:hypothetical protein
MNCPEKIICRILAGMFAVPYCAMILILDLLGPEGFVLTRFWIGLIHLAGLWMSAKYAVTGSTFRPGTRENA